MIAAASTPAATASLAGIPGGSVATSGQGKGAAPATATPFDALLSLLLPSSPGTSGTIGGESSDTGEPVIGDEAPKGKKDGGAFAAGEEQTPASPGFLLLSPSMTPPEAVPPEAEHDGAAASPPPDERQRAQSGAGVPPAFRRSDGFQPSPTAQSAAGSGAPRVQPAAPVEAGAQQQALRIEFAETSEAGGTPAGSTGRQPVDAASQDTAKLAMLRGTGCSLDPLGTLSPSNGQPVGVAPQNTARLAVPREAGGTPAPRSASRASPIPESPFQLPGKSVPDDTPASAAGPAQFAGRADIVAPAGPSVMPVDKNNSSQPLAAKRARYDVGDIGTETAKGSARMPDQVLSAPTASTEAFTPSPATPAAAVTAGDPPRTVHAVEAVRQVAEIAATLGEQEGMSVVSVSLDFGEEGPLTVQVSLRQGTVHAVFRSDSSDVRESITEAWRHYSAQRDQATAPLAEPVFLPLRAAAASAHAGFAVHQPPQQQQQTPSPSQDAPPFQAQADGQSDGGERQRHRPDDELFGERPLQAAPFANPAAPKPSSVSSQPKRNEAGRLAAFA